MTENQQILSDITVYMKYAKFVPELNRRETWDELVSRNMMMHIKKYPELKGEIIDAYKLVRDKKILPSMRSLQFAGKPIEINPVRIFNCFSRDTEFITSMGVKSFNDFNDGDSITVLSVDGTWNNAIVKSYGAQQLKSITFKKGRTEKVIKATHNHRWILKDGEETTTLKKGDQLLATTDILSQFDYDSASPMERLYWCYGFVFGDGTRVGEYSMARLCGKDNKFEYRFLEMGFKSSSPNSIGDDIMVYTGKYKKDAPNPDIDSPNLIRAFVLGYLQADGEKNADSTMVNDWVSIQTSDKDHWEFIEKCFPIAGIYINSKSDLTGKVTNYGTRPETYKYGLYHTIGKSNSVKWTVSNIEDGDIEETWCLEVENTHNFVLKNGMPTGNCAYLPISDWRAFSETMFLLLSGVGVGYSVQYHHVDQLPEITLPNNNRKRRFLVGDSIEGWSDAIKVLMKSYFFGGPRIEFDFSDVRPKGAKLITSGGKAPGPQPLKECLIKIDGILSGKRTGEKLSPIEVHDIECHIADAVLAGGIRRAALISLFSADDNDMVACKSGDWWELNPQRGRANNSVVLIRHKITEQFFMELWKKVEASGAGEPGIYLSNSKDWGCNPCCEIALRPNQFCNLVEVNVSDIESQDDLNNRVRAASFIGTLQAGYTNFHYLRSVWQRTTEKDALIGVSVTGVGSNKLAGMDLREAAKVVNAENERVAGIIGINVAARTTTLKPAGCRPWNSLVTATNGIYTLQELFTNHPENEQWGEFTEDISVIQDDAKSNRITRTYSNGVDSIYNITLAGQIQLQSTANHMWFVSEHYNKSIRNSHEKVNKFVRTDELVAGDVIDIKVGIYQNEKHAEFKTVNMFSIRMRDNTSTILQPTHMDEDLAWMLGYLWGDGTLSESKYRIRFIDEHIFNLEKAKRIIYEKFGVSGSILPCKGKKAYTLEIGSIQLYHWLTQNGIRKYFNNNIDVIPLCVRTSSYADIIAFIAGFCDADGCIYERHDKNLLVITQKYSFFTRHLQDVALAVGLQLNHSYNLKGLNFQSQKMIILMSLGSFTLKNSVDIFSKHSEKLKNSRFPNLPLINTEISSAKMTFGKVISVEYAGDVETYDIEIENDPWFYAGAIKSHNTTSLVLSTSSGIHAYHSQYYIRRLRVGKNEAIYQYLKNNHPELVEDEYFRPHDTAVISVPQKAPIGAILRTESPFDLLERVKSTYQSWILAGHRDGSNTHNISATISLKDDEWEPVGQWMWDNRNYYNGLSVLPYDGGTYKQTPFEEITEEQYNELIQHVHNIDLTQIKEVDDNTNLSGELACAGGGCEI